MDSILQNSVNEAIKKRKERQSNYYTVQNANDQFNLNNSIKNAKNKRLERQSNYYTPQNASHIRHKNRTAEKMSILSDYRNKSLNGSSVNVKDYKRGYVDEFGKATEKGEQRLGGISKYLLERKNRVQSVSQKTSQVANEVTEAKGFFKSVGKHKGKLGIAAAVVGTAVAMNAMTPKYDIPLDNLPASQRKQKLQDLMEIQKNMQSGVY